MFPSVVSTVTAFSCVLLVLTDAPKILRDVENWNPFETPRNSKHSTGVENIVAVVVLLDFFRPFSTVSTLFFCRDIS